MKSATIVIWSSIHICLQSCTSLTGLQDAKAIGKDNYDLGASINRGFNFEKSISSVVSNSEYVNLEFGGRYGYSDKVDLSFKINTNATLSLGTKYQLNGDKFSKNAFAAGLEVGSSISSNPVLNIQFPLYYSHYFNVKWTWNFSPRYVIQERLNFDDIIFDDTIEYLGGNTGFMYGSNNKLAIDFGLYNASVTQYGKDYNYIFYNVGIGGRFFFVDKKDEPQKKRPKRNKN